jgi:LysM repeat protein
MNARGKKTDGRGVLTVAARAFEPCAKKPEFYFAAMKRFFRIGLCVALLGHAAPRLAAQGEPPRNDNARRAAEESDRQEAEERAKRLRAIIEDLVAAQSAQQKRLLALIDDMKVLKDDTAEFIGKAATAADLIKLSDRVTELDQKRESDKELILAEINKLAKALTTAPAHPPAHPPTPAPTATANVGTTKEPDRKRPGGKEKIKTEIKAPETPTPPPPKPDKGVEHVVKSGEFLGAIITAYNDELKKLGKKTVTQKQILAANPGLNPNNVRVGQKIFIPVLD